MFPPRNTSNLENKSVRLLESGVSSLVYIFLICQTIMQPLPTKFHFPFHPISLPINILVGTGNSQSNEWKHEISLILYLSLGKFNLEKSKA